MITITVINDIRIKKHYVLNPAPLQIGIYWATHVRTTQYSNGLSTIADTPTPAYGHPFPEGRGF